MGEAGILREDDRVELIEGDIITMSPIGGRHAACVRRLQRLLHKSIGESAIVSTQNPIHLGDYSEPQPDLALLRPRGDFYASHPFPTDVLLVVEVAETTLAFDREVKIPMYARAMIPEVLLVDLEHDVVWQFTRPTNGTYQGLQEAGRGQSLTSTTVPFLSLSVDDILG